MTEEELETIEEHAQCADYPRMGPKRVQRLEQDILALIAEVRRLQKEMELPLSRPPLHLI